MDSNVLVAAFAARGLCADLLTLVLSERELMVPEVEVLDGAFLGGADILVSGDNDSLSVAETSPIRILSPRAFFTLARGGTL